MSFPAGLSSLELSPLWFKERARDIGGAVWETEEADPVWSGRASTTKLNFDLQQNWEGFIAKAVQDRLVIEFVDPIFYVPSAYRGVALPGGWDGLAEVIDVTDGGNPVFGGLPEGLQLRRGDRLTVRNETNSTYHMVAANTAVTDDEEQIVPLSPVVFPNVFAPGDEVVFLNPPVRLHIVANSWSVVRNARQEPVGSFAVEEAGIL